MTFLKATPQIAAAAFANTVGIEVVLGNCSSASTRGGTIQIPFFDHNIPKQLNAAWGYVANQAGHIRYNHLINTVRQTLLDNITYVMCDTFAERQMIKEWQGLTGVFDDVNKILIEDKSLVLPSGDTQPEEIYMAFCHAYSGAYLLNYNSLKNLAVNCEQLAIQTFGRGVVIRTKVLLQEILSCKNSQEVECLANKLLTALTIELEKEQQDPPPSQLDENPSNQGEDQDQGEGETQEGGQSNPSDSADPNASNKPDSEGQSNSGQQKANTQNGEQPKASQSTDSIINSASNSEGQSQDKQNQALSDLLNSSKSGFGDTKTTAQKVADLIEPITNPEPLLIPASPIKHSSQGVSNLAQGAMKDSVCLRESLMTILATATQCEEYRARVGRRVVRTAPQRLARGDTKIFIREEEGRFPDTAISLLVDLSGSMSIRESEAKKAIMALSFACDGLEQLSLEIMSFQDNSVDRLKPFGESAFNTKPYDMVKAGGGTPLQMGISASLVSLLAQPAERHVLWVLTDGSVSDQSNKLIEKARNENVSVMGLFIGSMKKDCKSHMTKLFKSDWLYLQDTKALQLKLFELANSLVTEFI